MPTLGNRLKKARMDRRLSQHDLANLISVSQSAVAHWERAKNEPSLEQLGCIAKALEITEDWLAFGPSASSDTVKVIAEMVKGDLGRLSPPNERFVKIPPPAEAGELVDAIEIMDDSLYPQYKQFDVLFVSRAAYPAAQMAKTNAECLIELDNGKYEIRRLTATGSPAKWNLESFQKPTMPNVEIRFAKPIMWVARSVTGEQTSTIME